VKKERNLEWVFFLFEQIRSIKEECFSGFFKVLTICLKKERKLDVGSSRLEQIR
jgi:hypothetical protein